MASDAKPPRELLLLSAYLFLVSKVSFFLFRLLFSGNGQYYFHAFRSHLGGADFLCPPLPTASKFVVRSSLSGRTILGSVGALFSVCSKSQGLCFLLLGKHVVSLV